MGFAMRMKDTKGFTLVEVIVVLVILAILAALLIPAMTGWIDKARDKDVYVELRTVALAVQAAYDETYAECRLDGSEQVLYSTLGSSADPWDTVFEKRMREYIDDSIWPNVSSASITGGEMYIYYNKDGDGYVYHKDAGGEVTITKS